MFSGIVEELGEVRSRSAGRLSIGARTVLDGLRIGDSVAVDGACLTVVEVTRDGFAADVMPETESHTTVGVYEPGRRVNLERALEMGERIGGHLLTGHVDTTAVVSALREDRNARWATIDAAASVVELAAPKGCIAVDGISLTVVDVFETAFTVSLIPHTLTTTTAGTWRPGSAVNVETDLIARYVWRAQEHRAGGRAGRDTMHLEVR